MNSKNIKSGFCPAVGHKTTKLFLFNLTSVLRKEMTKKVVRNKEIIGFFAGIKSVF